jgi:hypothetical protein
MRLKDDVYYLKQELGDIRQESFALEMLKDYKKQNKRLFAIILIVLGLWFATGVYLVYILNDIGVEEVTTEESYDVTQDDGNNNFINGNENNVTNGTKN